MATSSKAPPRFVPTLTEVVVEPHAEPKTTPKTTPKPAPQEVPPLPAALVLPPEPSVPPEILQEQWVQQLLQRVDGALNTHLHEAIAKVVQEQTRIALLRLGEEIEQVVRQVVRETIEQEQRTASNGGSCGCGNGCAIAIDAFVESQD